jgi:hypothetical protein
MPSIAVSTNTEIIPPGRYEQVFLQNIGPDACYIRWDGKSIVTTGPSGNADAGVLLDVGDSIELYDSYPNSRTADKGVYGTSSGASDVRIIIG